MLIGIKRSASFSFFHIRNVSDGVFSVILSFILLKLEFKIALAEVSSSLG